MPRPTLEVITRNSGQAKRSIVRRYQQLSLLMQLLPFDNSVVPSLSGGGGRSLAYAYERDKQPRGAQFRDWYQDYPADYQDTEPVVTYLRPLGGAFEIDRVFVQADGSISPSTPGLGSFVNENVDALARATVGLFANTAVNGDKKVNNLAFDGLSTILDGTTSEFNGSGLTIAEGATVDNYTTATTAMKKFINRIKARGLAPVIFTNEDSALRLEMAAIKLGYTDRKPSGFGQDIVNFAGAPIIDLGARVGTTGDSAADSVIPTTTGAGASGGLTDIYIVGLGLSGFHGVTLTGDSGVTYYSNLGDTKPGVTKRVECEMVGTVALKDTKAAYVLRDVRVQPQV
ncbi:hypothetical protein DEIPH_ctg013orf0025 [Deinococcus phoenicis]|uniref:Phage capsid protein n=1 Tax=Deinococcus phoenicis TaxID=1476583 RepID=A0A016QSF0_9DEIO|nr:hypothetical protein [Deinococcus phoenicis]EYB68921.1 hypothetical protein DEIPH_ctg013orf0025 [Deinococcus phoenicis]